MWSGSAAAREQWDRSHAVRLLWVAGAAGKEVLLRRPNRLVRGVPEEEDHHAVSNLWPLLLFDDPEEV